MKRLLVVLLFLLGVAGAIAQEDRGRISGLVTDPTGAVIPQADVVLTSEATGVTTTAVSNGEGLYAFPLLVPGLYTVDVKANGFHEYILKSVRVEIAANVRVDAKLTMGSESESVTVTASNVNALKTDDAILGTTIEARSFNDLPLLTGNSFSLQLLAPGVSSTSLTADFNHTYEGGNESASINGSQTSRTEFTLDGAPNTRNASGVTTAYTPSRDFISEFRMITSPYDASMAHTSGGSLDASLKAGGSQIHGGMSGFYQDPHTDATQFVQSNTITPPQYKFHRESVNLGGPILKDKLFAFLGYEHQYNQDPASTSSNQTVPTKLQKKEGDFSELLALNTTLQTTKITCPTTGSTVSLTYNQYQLFDPYTTTAVPNCSGYYTRTPITNNQLINSSHGLDTVGMKLASYYPDANTGSTTYTNNFIPTAANHDYYWSAVGRLDYVLNSQQKLFGHYVASRRIQPRKAAYYPGASGKDSLIKNKAATLDYVNTLTNTSMLDVHVSFSRVFTSTTISQKTSATDLGINANATAGIPEVANGFPYFAPSSYAKLGDTDPTAEGDTILDGQVTYSKMLGRHQLKLGASWRKYQANYANYTNEKLYIASSGTYTKGPFSSNSAALGASLASIELGIAESTKETLNARTTSNTDYWAGFVQDDFKISPKLTINAGLRYEYFGPLSERNGKSLTYFDPTVSSPIEATAVANYAAKATTPEQALVATSAFKVKGGVHFATPGQDLWNSQHLNFSPRLGFSYNPIEKLVVRGGFGLFYQHIGEYLQYASPDGYTQSTSTTASNDNGQTYVGTLQNPFPNGLTQPTGNTQGLYQDLGTSLTGAFVQNPKTPYSIQYSFGFQYALPKDLMFEANYIGTMGRHLKISRTLNALPDSMLSTDSTLTTAQLALYNSLIATYPNPFNGITVPASQSLFTATSISGTQLVYPYPQYTSLTLTDWAGMSSYNALQLTLSKRFSHGYNMSVGYTQSKTLDALSFLNSGDSKPWYGISNSDYPRVLTTSAIYELPFGKGKLLFGSKSGWVSQLISGYQVQGTYRIQSGQALTFSSADTSLAAGKTFKDINGPSAHNTTQWFNTHAFNNYLDNKSYTSLDPTKVAMARDNLRTFPLRMNGIRADYQDILNVGALRRIKLHHDQYSVEFRGEAVNALNHQVFASPNTTPSSSTFGTITGPGNYARRLQYAVTMSF